MKTILKTFALSLLATPLFGQLYVDENALSLTMLSLNGNARYVGMGGALGALGGNLATLSTNPAGIGIYRSGEFSFTPALTIGQTNTMPDNDKKHLGEQWNFNLGNLGWVGVIDLSSSDSKNEWKKIQLGIGLNRLADFWSQSRYNRYADPGKTYLDVLTTSANTSDLDDAYSGLAYKADLIYYDTAYNGYYNDLEYQDEKSGDWYQTGAEQRHTTKTTGAINEWVFSIGGNYGDKLFLGATIGVPVVNYRVTRNLMEIDENDDNPIFNYWKLQEKLELTGNGINLKFGAIYKPADFVRLGLAVHTPTRYSLKEKYSTEISGDTWVTDPDNRYESLNEYEFNLRTPMRVIASAGFVIAKKAVIGVEYEHVNYGRMFLNDEWGGYDEDNDYIVETYGKGGTLKVGAEYRFDPAVSLRVGYNYTRPPYEDNSFNDFSQQTLSAGLGFNLGSMTVDVAYANTFRNYKYIPYSTLNVNQYKTSGQQFLVTLGWRF